MAVKIFKVCDTCGRTVEEKNFCLVNEKGAKKALCPVLFTCKICREKECETEKLIARIDELNMHKFHSPAV